MSGLELAFVPLSGATWAAASLALGRCTKCAAGGGPAIFRRNPRAFSAGTSLANGSDGWGITSRVFKNYIFVLICSHLTLVIMYIVTYILYIYIYFIYIYFIIIIYIYTLYIYI